MARREKVDYWLYDEAGYPLRMYKYRRHPPELGWAFFQGVVGAVLVVAVLGLGALFLAVGPVWRALIGAAVLGFLVLCRAWIALGFVALLGLLTWIW